MPRARVVLVHGIRTSATMWRGQLLRLAQHDIDAVAIDLPAHGRRLGEPFSLEAAFRGIDAALNPGDGADADEAARAARTSGVDAVAVRGGDADRSEGDDGRPVPRLLVGLSLGGYLALEYAARHPGRFDGLVAASCGTRPRGPGYTGYLRLAALIRRLPDRGRALNDAMARLFLPRSAVDDVLAGGVALDVMADAVGAVGGIDVEDAVRRVDAPIWFVNGRFDHFRLEERRMLRAARDGRLVVIPGATHMVSLVRPDDFTAAVLGAVAELERRAAASARESARR